MAWVRHASRLVHATVYREVTRQLELLDWMSTDAGVRPFGDLSAPVRMRDTSAIASDKLAADIGAGTLACTLGDELPSEMQEVGGPLSLQEYPIFFDVFQENQATALAVATDVRDILMGRLPNTQRFLPLLDMKQNPPVAVAGWQIELDDIERVSPEHRFALHWQVVKVTASAYFPEVLY